MRRLLGVVCSSLAAAEAGNFMHDMNIVLVTQLREEVESLKKTLAQRDKLLLEKEIKVSFGDIILLLFCADTWASCVTDLLQT